MAGLIEDVQYKDDWRLGINRATQLYLENGL